MAKGKKGVDGVDKVISLFPAGSHKMIERLLARAAQKDAKTAGRNVKKALQGMTRGNRVASKLAGNLAAELGRALHHRGDVGGNKTSIRQKSPESGGRPFHFAHSVVHKGDAAPGASAKSGAGKAGRAAAHMRYIEREIAVERSYGEGLRDPALAEERERRGLEAERSEIAPGAGRGVDDVAHASGASAGQGYIENPVKLANGEQIIFSFGTIGDRFEDRVRFWEALEEAEAHPDARVQHRLIVELPHEASAQARFEMVKEFTKRFESDGVPYWAALHAPGKENDSRNYHAHIVYSERPAKRMIDPEAPAEGEKWDFEVVNKWVDSSRHKRESRPHKQEKLRSYHARDFIPTIRKEFSETVNAVLERDAIKDKGGAAVRYDARSYKDMGVDAVPMRSINRIVADKLKGGKATVLDGDYTKRMITAELREAAAKRQKGVMELIALDDVLRAMAETGRPQAMNAKLPKELRVSPWANPTKAAMKVASRKILEVRHAALQIDVMERATTASLERIIAATAPKAVAAAAKARDPVVKGQAPSPDGASLLHAAALDELAATKASTAKARRSIGYKIGNAVNEWRELVGAEPPQISPAVKAAIRQMDQQEEVAEREARGPDVRPASSEKARRTEGPGQETARGEGGRAAPVRGTEAPRTPRDAAEARRAEPTVRPATVGREGTRPTGPSVASTAGSRGAAVPGPGRSADRRVAAARPAGLPMTMEERLKVAMPPTNADLEAASKMVSGWIRAATEGEPDPQKRIENVVAFVKELAKAGQERKEGLIRAVDGPKREAAPSDAVAGGPVAPAGKVVAERSREPVPTGRGQAEAEGAREADAPARSGRSAESVTPGVTDGRGTTGTKVLGGGQAPRQEDLFAEEARPKAAVEVSDKAEAALPREAAVGKAESEGKAPATETTGSRPSDDADDARRRKKREEEEKRKRKRQAVLGRQNRGRSR